MYAARSDYICERTAASVSWLLYDAALAAFAAAAAAAAAGDWDEAPPVPGAVFSWTKSTTSCVGATARERWGEVIFSRVKSQGRLLTFWLSGEL